jgi:hypothetical protein
MKDYTKLGSRFYQKRFRLGKWNLSQIC